MRLFIPIVGLLAVVGVGLEGRAQDSAAQRVNILRGLVNPVDKDWIAHTENYQVVIKNEVRCREARNKVFSDLKIPYEERVEAMKQAELQYTVFLQGHKLEVLSAAWSANGKQFITGSRDRTARIWNPVTGQQLFSLAHDSPVILVSFSAQDERVLTSPGAGSLFAIHEALAKKTPLNASGRIHLWDAANGKKIKEFEPDQEEILAAALSPKGDVIAAAGRDKTLCIWSTANGELLHRWKLKAPLFQIQFAPDGMLLGAVFGGKNVRIFDVATRKELAPLEGMTEAVFCFILSTDGRNVLAAGSYKSALHKVDPFVRTMNMIGTLGITEMQNMLFGTTSETPTVLWNLPTRKIEFQGPAKNFGRDKQRQFGFDNFNRGPLR